MSGTGTIRSHNTSDTNDSELISVDGVAMNLIDSTVTDHVDVTLVSSDIVGSDVDLHVEPSAVQDVEPAGLSSSTPILRQELETSMTTQQHPVAINEELFNRLRMVLNPLGRPRSFRIVDSNGRRDVRQGLASSDPAEEVRRSWTRVTSFIRAVVGPEYDSIISSHLIEAAPPIGSPPIHSIGGERVNSRDDLQEGIINEDMVIALPASFTPRPIEETSFIASPPILFYNGFYNGLSEEQEEFTVEEDVNKLRCNHIFHLECIKPWLM
ncbi:uncharacterized protein LOC124916219 [Impatiens glandulifera]|uniref:uncharacterized protein LOC124916219 n=1 Tax=Impatiens glandulifera TaxID=253017 RepID=UPI001FB06E1E|nr:uncharacterized protein LOC124916219 [Impatiens glandulifera]